VKGFIDRARLKGVGECAVAQLCPGQVLALVGLVAGVVGERQYLARDGVQHHHAAGLRLVQQHRLAQLLVGKKLDLAVDAQCNVGAINRGYDLAHVFNSVAQAVLDHTAHSGLPTNDLLYSSSMPSCPLSSTLVKPTTCAAASPSGYWRL